MNSGTIKTLTKIGMVGSMAMLVIPQFQGRHGGRHGRQDFSKDLHVLAGIALIGFSVWHYNCYQPPVWIKD